jgi:RNA polymerase sigma factor (SigM family)
MMKRETWADLFAAYQNPLYRYLYRMCGSREVAEELLQETFYRAMLSFTLRDAKAVRAWLYKVARHLYIDWLRRQTAERKMVDSICRLVGRGYAGGDPETAYEQKEAAQTVERIMRQLPERMRTILYLREIEGFSYDELAAAMELNMNQVKVTLHRAREKFREVEARMERSEEDGRDGR